MGEWWDRHRLTVTRWCLYAAAVILLAGVGAGRR